MVAWIMDYMDGKGKVKTGSETILYHCFSDALKGYRERPVAFNIIIMFLWNRDMPAR